MTRFKLLGAAAILSLLAATPALAQHMIDEPGMFAFVYPMGDLGIASSRAPADARAMMLRNDSAPAFGTRIMRHPTAGRARSVK
jgi:hypothetical protein